MKNAVIGGFLALIGTMWSIAIGIYAELNLVQSWNQWRFLDTVIRSGLIVPFVLSAALLVLGVAVLLIGLFRKEK